MARHTVKRSDQVRRQRPVRGGRESMSPCVLREIEQAVTSEARKYNASRSFIIAYALGRYFHIDEQESYK